MYFSMKKLFLSFSSLSVIILVSSCNGGKTEKKANILALQQVTVQHVESVERSQTLSYSGTIEPHNTVQIGFAVPGVINHIAVQEGQFVQKGQMLAGIDDTEYRNALAIANAGLEQAEDLFRRLNELYKKSSLPEKDYIEIKTKLAQAIANKQINAKRIADSKLYAPMAGIITAKPVERGSMAAPGIPAFTIIKTDLVYAKITVPENEVGNIRKNMDASVEVPAIGKTLSGKITIINPQADAVSKTYIVKIQLPNPGQLLLPGMIINVNIRTGKPVKVITVPAKSILHDADEIAYVFIVNDRNKAMRKRVTIGALTGSEDIIIKDGLLSGDKVIVEGQSKVKDGSPVQIQ
jgi:RND family efflux transporter MFP subunit